MFGSFKSFGSNGKKDWNNDSRNTGNSFAPAGPTETSSPASNVKENTVTPPATSADKMDDRKGPIDGAFVGAGTLAPKYSAVGSKPAEGSSDDSTDKPAENSLDQPDNKDSAESTDSTSSGRKSFGEIFAAPAPADSESKAESDSVDTSSPSDEIDKKDSDGEGSSDIDLSSPEATDKSAEDEIDRMFETFDGNDEEPTDAEAALDSDEDVTVPDDAEKSEDDGLGAIFNEGSDVSADNSAIYGTPSDAEGILKDDFSDEDPKFFEDNNKSPGLPADMPEDEDLTSVSSTDTDHDEVTPEIGEATSAPTLLFLHQESPEKVADTLEIYTKGKSTYLIDMTDDKSGYKYVPHSAARSFVSTSSLPQNQGENEYDILDVVGLIGDSTPGDRPVLVLTGANELVNKVYGTFGEDSVVLGLLAEKVNEVVSTAYRSGVTIVVVTPEITESLADFMSVVDSVGA